MSTNPESAAKIVTERRPTDIEGRPLIHSSQLNPNDVVLGKGYRSREYSGTKQFHHIVRNHVDIYYAANGWREKSAVAMAIVRSIGALDPPGRFLRELNASEAAGVGLEDTAWIMIDNAVVVKKIKQALRDSRQAQNNDIVDQRPSPGTGSTAPLPNLFGPPLAVPSVSYPFESNITGVTGMFYDFGVLARPNPVLVPLNAMSYSPLIPLETQGTTSGHNAGEKRARVEPSEVSYSSLGLPVRSMSPLSSLQEDGPLSNPNKDEEEAAEQLLALLTSEEAPRFTAEEALHEKETMTEQERVVALSDMFGTFCEVSHVDKRARRPSGDPIEALIGEMRRLVDNMPSENKPTLLEAIRRASPREFSNERLELFLRREALDPLKAAQRFVNYWEERRKIFGDKCFLPMTLNGALRGDEVALEAGIMQVVPGFDLSGRQIVWFPMKNHTRRGYSTLSAARAMWYIYEMLCEDPSVTKGVVHLLDGQNASLFELDLELDTIYSRFTLAAMPLSICSMHMCGFPFALRRYVLPLWLALADRETRSRTLIHDCSETSQLVDMLGRYGITPEVIPTELGGTSVMDPSEWLEDRQRRGK